MRWCVRAFLRLRACVRARARAWACMCVRAHLCVWGGRDQPE